MQNNFAENFYSDTELFKEFREEYGTITAKRMYEYVKLSEINSKSDLSEELKFLLGILLSNTSYKNKRSGKMLLKSVAITIIKLPLLAIQFRKSLNKANAMLKQGSKIEWLS